MERTIQVAQARELIRRLVLLSLTFTTLFLVAGPDGEPGGPLFVLLIVYVSARCSGAVAAALRLPPLLGMLCMGLALRNVPYVGERVGARVDPAWSSAIRLFALTLILTRAGLAFDLEALRRLRFVVARLAVMPCLSEVLIIMALASWWLAFPLPWAAMLGFVVAAISPAVVVPSLLALQEQGYGKSTGIPTMVVAAAPLDDVLAIAGFGICLSFSVGSDSGEAGWLDYARAPLELVLGLGVGAIAAVTIVFLTPSPANPDKGAADDGVSGRLSILAGAAVTCAFALKRANFSGASALSTLVLSVGATRGWGAAATKPMSSVLKDVWDELAQPLLFGLVGSTVALDSLEVRIVGIGLGMLLCSLPARSAAAYLAVGGRGLRWQERSFTALAWMPKATVQAAIGAVALDEARTEEERARGREVLAIAVLSILCTAPLGAIAIWIFGPRLLLRDDGEAGDGAKAKEAGPKSEPANDVAEIWSSVAPHVAPQGAPVPDDECRKAAPQCWDHVRRFVCV